jgi:sugar lactone lactonase YvrE
MRRTPLAALAVLLLAAGPAHGAAFQEVGGLASYATDVTLGPDGNLWVAEQPNGSVARMTPSGEVIGRFAVGTNPTALAVGPGGRVWVTVPDSDKLTWFDATSPSPSPHDVATGSGSNCGAVGIAAGNGRIYFTLPTDGVCSGNVSQVGFVSDDGSGVATKGGAVGRAFDIAVSGGKLFVPDFDGNVVRRLSPDLVTESTVSVGSGSPQGVAADSAGNIWTSLFTDGKLARFPGAQMNGSATVVTPSGGTLTNPRGLTAGPDGAMYVAGGGSANLVRVGAGDQFSFFAMPGGGAPFGVDPGPDADLWMTDGAARRLLRFVDGAPRAATGETGAITVDGATVAGQVDPRGNDTQVVFDYGTTDAYGQTAAAGSVGAAARPTGVQAQLTGLAPNTTYHYRARATNALGEVAGADRTFTTLPDTTPPEFASAKLTNTRFAVNPKGLAETLVKSAKPKRGTTFVYALPEPARVLFDVQQKVAGRMVGRKCRKPSRTNRTRPRCNRLARIGRFAHASLAGETRKKFSGKIGKRTLKPGGYLVTLTATDLAGNRSQPKALNLRVVPPR